MFMAIPCVHQKVKSRVLRSEWEYVYHLALVDSELRNIFANTSLPTAQTQHSRIGQKS